MKDNIKNIVIIFSVIAIFVLGYFLFKKPIPDRKNLSEEWEEIDRIKEEARIELKKIDSLQERVKELELEIGNSKEEIVKLDTIIIREREKIKYLPITEGVELLKNNLEEYESEINP